MSTIAPKIATDASSKRDDKGSRARSQPSKAATTGLAWVWRAMDLEKGMSFAALPQGLKSPE